MMNTLRTITFAALSLLAFVEEGRTWTWQSCNIFGAKVTQFGAFVVLSPSALGFPRGDPWRVALESVAMEWLTPSRLNYIIGDDDRNVGTGNGESEVWWSSGITAPAVTLMRWNPLTCYLTETDIVFNNTVPYTSSKKQTDLWAYGGTRAPFQTAAMHEFGHAQGLQHTADMYSVMGGAWTHIHGNGGTATAYPGEDAIEGSIAVYGRGAPWEVDDLGVAHWRHTGELGGYSTHARTRLFDAAGVELPKVAGSFEPMYLVAPSQVVMLEMTYENMGTRPLTVKVGYYLSRDNLITSSDWLLTTASLTLVRNRPYTANVALTIPAALGGSVAWPAGTYWLGAIVDYDGTVAGDVWRSNNAAYTAAIRVP